MFGYACNETDNYMPLALELSHQILKVLADFRRSNTRINYLRPDAKSQVTIEYNDNDKPVRIDTIVVSTQHDPFDSDDYAMLSKIKSDIIKIVIPKVFENQPDHIKLLLNDSIKYHINPTGKLLLEVPTETQV